MKSNAELLQDFIEKLTSDYAIGLIQKDKGVAPTFVFLTKDDCNKTEEHILIIPEELMDKGRAGKEFFMNEIFPEVRRCVQHNGKEIVSIAFICEAWKSKNLEAANNENLNETNSDEVLMFSFHYPGNRVDFIYSIIRLGENFILGPKEVKQSKYQKDEIGRFSQLFD